MVGIYSCHTLSTIKMIGFTNGVNGVVNQFANWSTAVFTTGKEVIMRYSIEEIEVSAVGYDWSDVRFLKPTGSYETVRARLLQLAKRSFLYVRKFIVYYGSCPFSYVTVLDGTIIEERQSGDLRTSAQKDDDHRYYNRSRLRNQRVGQVRGDLSSWIASAPRDREACTIVDKNGYAPQQKVAGTVTGYKMYRYPQGEKFTPAKRRKLMRDLADRA